MYDSVAARPLAGATVQLLAADGTAPFAATASTDPQGAYALRAIPAGTYLVGFQHPALDSLALASPLRRVVVNDTTPVRVDLSVPSASSILHRVCGDRAADSTGLIVGQVRDARSGLPVRSGGASATWDVYTIQHGSIRHETLTATSSVSATGWFALCRVPAGVDLAIRGWSGGDTSGVLIASLPVGVVHRDLSLGGTTNVRGELVGERGEPIPNARLQVEGRTAAATTDSAGRFFLGELPAGTQTVQARALGFAPADVTLQLAANRDTTVRIAMITARHMLDTMRVVAQRVFDRDTQGFEHRRTMGFGFFRTADDIRQRRPYDTYSLLNEVPFLHVAFGGGGGMGSVFDRVVSMTPNVMSGGCSPELFIDGIRVRDMLGQLDVLVRPNEIRGIEVYRSGDTPAQFTSPTNLGCGAIVIWTQPVTKVRPQPN